jgi:hypothetical protein
MPAKGNHETDPKEFAALVKESREMTPSQRLTRVFELTEAHHAQQREAIRLMYPAADEREVFLRVAALRLDREMMIKVYGWDPDLKA